MLKRIREIEKDKRLGVLMTIIVQKLNVSLGYIYKTSAPKVFVIVNITVSESYKQSASLHKGLLQQNWFKGRVELFFNLDRKNTLNDRE